MEKFTLCHMENLETVFNTLTADDEYSLLNRGTLTQHIQMHLSQKERNSFELFCKLFKSTLNLEHSQKRSPS